MIRPTVHKEFLQFCFAAPSDRTVPHCLIDTALIIVLTEPFPIERTYFCILYCVGLTHIKDYVDSRITRSSYYQKHQDVFSESFYCRTSAIPSMTETNFFGFVSTGMITLSSFASKLTFLF